MFRYITPCLPWCRYRGHEYNCNLATTCVFGGQKPMDLCNGGMIWSCCVDRDKVDFVDPELGAVKDAQCGEVHTTGGQARIVGGHDSKERILSSYHQTQKFKTDCSSVKPEL